MPGLASLLAISLFAVANDAEAGRRSLRIEFEDFELRWRILVLQRQQFRGHLGRCAGWRLALDAQTVEEQHLPLMPWLSCGDRSDCGCRSIVFGMAVEASDKPRQRSHAHITGVR
jgi:hypothetical protein